jgi:CBS domain-containing protein
VAVVDSAGFAGLVTLSDIRSVPREERARTAVSDVMAGAASVVTIPLQASLGEAIDALARGGHEGVPVLDGAHVVALLTRADIIRELEVRDELGMTA